MILKNDALTNRLRTLRDRHKHFASAELMNVLDSAFMLQEMTYAGVISGDKYIKLPRIQYNEVEKNAHLSSQRGEQGAVNVRAFRIPSQREGQDSMLKSQYVASVERALPQRRALSTLHLNQENGQQEVFMGTYFPKKLEPNT